MFSFDMLLFWLETCFLEFKQNQCLQNSRTHSLQSASNLFATLNPTKRMTPKVEIHLTGIQSVQK